MFLTLYLLTFVFRVEEGCVDVLVLAPSEDGAWHAGLAWCQAAGYDVSTLPYVEEVMQICIT